MSDLDEYIEKGEIVFLERHITELESRLAESKDAKSQISQYVYDLGNTITTLKKIMEFYVRLS